ncbi:hypothetical protein EGW08_006528 [Elysia chlorotica]|uniref:Uncharacterized protein n=1 Tax=Elysia chlorotica TaxID=188477 RepID=A0A3S1C8A1_ELYCH|nr:hypothetical protein EGW08_006528 [Elysia chlorotica]
MCFGVGIGFCLALIDNLPYVCLVTVPLLGSFYGADTIYRLSILLIIHSFVVECIPNVLWRVIPLLNIVLLGVIVYLPVSITPWPIVWVYTRIMWLTEPMLMVAEVILLLNYVMRMSQIGADEIEENEDSAFKYKAAILLFSSMCYAVTASLAYDMYLNATPSQVLCLFVIVFLMIAAHNMMLMAHEGIISDCAFFCLLSTGITYIMVLETRQISSPLAEPSLWTQSPLANSSVVNIMYSILHMTSSSAQRSVLFLKRFFTPLFLGLLAVRLYGILFIVNKVTRNFFQDDKNSPDCFEETVRDDFEEFSPWKSPLLLRLSIIFMLTQMSGQFLEEWSGQTSSVAGFSYLASASKNIWPREILFGRLIQVSSISGFYMWRLYRANDWTWNPWLTP